MSGATSKKRTERLVALAILLVGLAAAGVSWFTLAPAAQVDPDIDFMEHSKKYERQVEVIGGKSAMFAEELDDALATAWEGRNRAVTIAVGSVLLAGAYLLLCRARDLADADREAAGRER